MSKVWKVFGIIGMVITGLAVTAGVLVAVIASIGNKPFVPDGYELSVKTGGDIEAKYLKYGEYDTSYKEYPVLQDFSKYEIYYPSELENSNKTYPMVIVCNGSGLPASKYTNLFKHLASWGFVVVGTEETYSWNGMTAEVCARYMIDLNNKEDVLVGDKNEKSPFYHRIDLDNVGITGHSQGGVGVFNTITVQEHASLFKTAVTLSPTKFELADNLYWHYDVSTITIPTMMLCGTEENAYVDPTTLKEIYDAFPTDTPRLMATRDNAEHNDMLYFSDGYVTAWFVWQLKNDTNASSAFVGDNAEILNNSLYKNQNKTI